MACHHLDRDTYADGLALHVPRGTSHDALASNAGSAPDGPIGASSNMAVGIFEVGRST